MLMGQLVEEGSLAIAIPVKKENSKASDHFQIPLELLNEFENGLATMIPIIKKDTLQARLPAMGLPRNTYPRSARS